MPTLRMPKCTISYGPDWKGVIGDIPGMVTSIGSNPNVSVRISRWDEDEGRLINFDRLTDASFEQDKHTGITKVTGRSQKLIQEQKIADGQVTLILTPAKGCKDCM